MPREWQATLAQDQVPRSNVIRIPTGYGKTLGVLGAWLYHRVERGDDRWPRRLVWTLPMRVLVEQTTDEVQKCLGRLGLLWQPNTDHRGKVGVHILMGGTDQLGEWSLYPEEQAVLVTTQDMALSRALNRGYASARARWPMEFGLLNHDALWVMDEVQLMDVGLATSAQLQAFRDGDQDKSLRPCHTWWMSATLQPEWLRSVDTMPQHDRWIASPCKVPKERRTGGLWDVQKTLATSVIARDDAAAFAQRILEEHAKLVPGEFGRITLVVCNTVKRACETFDSLRDAGRKDGLELVHSRFRPSERSEWRRRFLSREACTGDADRIIVATQVIEAGVDISAGCLITELAPWSSLVQRFGRCARYGGSGAVFVVDRWVPKHSDDERSAASAAPYEPADLQAAWEELPLLTGAGVAALEVHEESLSPEHRAQLYPYSPKDLLMRRDFDELFDTTPDLTGADLDIGRFIRSGDERDLQVFWLDLAQEEAPVDERRPQREELCAVPFLEARDWLCGPEAKTHRKPKLRGGMRAWVWDWIDGEWQEATRASLLPGRVVCVAGACGGYRADRGFDAKSGEPVTSVVVPRLDRDVAAFEGADDRQDGEELSYNPWKTIACHTKEVADQARLIARQVGLSEQLQDIVESATLWHDWGKSHPAFQGALKASPERPDRVDLAKGPENAWRHRRDMYRYLDDSESRPAFRHELASALGLFALLQAFKPKHEALLGPWTDVLARLGKPLLNSGELVPDSPLVQRLLKTSADEFDLLTYLVASHHGKVRVALHAAPKDQEYRDRDGRGLPIRGIREGDRLPSVVLVPGEPALPEVTLTLAPAALGLSEKTGRSWRERSQRVLERFGPGALALLEAVLRAADVRASCLRTDDPALLREVTA